MNRAKKTKNDEFYTLYEDVSAELVKYEDQLKGKAILCPCDWDWEELTDAQKQEYKQNGFVEGINDNFAFSQFLRAKNSNIGLNSNWQNKLYFSHYNPNTGGEGRPFQIAIREFAKRHPDGVVITNPPFSLFREFIDVLIEYNLKFLIIGNKNALTYKKTFSLFMENKLSIGYTAPKKFVIKNNENRTVSVKKLEMCIWFTNLDIDKKEKLILTEKYNPEKYPKYDNYDAINVNKTKDIPYDYDGLIGVPVTFLEKYNPEQFEIIGHSRYLEKHRGGDVKINGKTCYVRIIIKNLNPNKGFEL
ncbi:adenine-specific methyltransferase EcoRI family protein [Mycoplasmopsis pullorum]|uniref:adenine-specific methyltransferase EcoRI family protein n=2 Tax=Metamycoplasmataceae TaxID=2895623 RepID=UPI001118E7D9|nr:adenine-specific methyltransferase EcoRI family protein [Mycoplasmopsis pullorum]TNK83577.1 hypothetical protein C4M93_02020 [Mycoplasmopsis pullorum]TNK88019.1 hypothetical protein C4M89_03895 [Mycoplasmopsis pullorum]TNK91758.1 hypothetical protein C4M96_03510 [Mycoplasmopsis pullorum]